MNSANYAASLAQQGLRTLLVDLDLRRPMVETFFMGKSSRLPGMTDYFLAERNLKKCGSKTRSLPNCAGTPPEVACPTRRNCSCRRILPTSSRKRWRILTA